MRKTGNHPLLFSLLFILLASWGTAEARQIQVEARASASDLFYGESFQLTIEISSAGSFDASPPQLPAMEAFRPASSVPSRGTRVSIVNGKTERSTTYTYTLTAIKTGTHTLPPLRVTVNNQPFETRPLQIRVVDRGSVDASGQTRLPSIFVALEPADKNPVIGQEILTEVVLYFKEQIEVTSFRPGAGWQPDSFWKEDLENEEQPRAESTIYKGQRYRKATLLRYALFPSISGNLQLPPFPLTVTIRDRSSRNDPFGSFFGRATSQNVELMSEPVDIRVKTLPALPPDALALNAVGEFTVQREISKTTAIVGESIELITTIEGSGNIPLIQRPSYNLPDQFDLFNPREISDLKKKGTTVQGTRQFTEFLIPRAPGTYTLPQERLAFYHPKTESIQFVTIPSIRVDVRSAPNLLAGSQDGRVFALQPVRGLALWTGGEPVAAFQRIWFWLLALIPPAALLISYRLRSFRDKLQTDTNFRRRHHAAKTAEGYLTQARSFAEHGDAKEAYRLIERALTGYISDRLNLPEAGYATDELLQHLPESTKPAGHTDHANHTNHADHADHADRKKLKMLLDRCTSIGYAPPGTAEETRSDVDAANALLQNLKRWLS